MQSVIGVRGTLVFLLIYAALGWPEIRTCLENGGGAGSCVVMGTLVGGFKAGLHERSEEDRGDPSGGARQRAHPSPREGQRPLATLQKKNGARSAHQPPREKEASRERE